MYVCVCEGGRKDSQHKHKYTHAHVLTAARVRAYAHRNKWAKVVRVQVFKQERHTHTRSHHFTNKPNNNTQLQTGNLCDASNTLNPPTHVTLLFGRAPTVRIQLTAYLRGYERSRWQEDEQDAPGEPYRKLTQRWAAAVAYDRLAVSRDQAPTPTLGADRDNY